MADIDNNSFENLLASRYVPQPPDYLQERIIAMAARTPQNAFETKAARPFGSGLIDMWSGFWDGLMLPAPAYSMALVLVVGVYMGASLQATDLPLADLGDSELYTYFEIANSADYGDWI